MLRKSDLPTICRSYCTMTGEQGSYCTMTGEETLTYVYDVLDISEKSRELLLNTAKIKTIDCLLRSKDQFRYARFVGINNRPQRDLFKFVCWLINFKHKNNRVPSNWLKEFDEDVFDDFVQNGEVETATQRMDLEDLSMAPGPRNKLGKHLFRMYQEGIPLRFEEFFASLDEKRNALVNYVASEVQENNFSNVLKERCNFDISEVVVKIVERILGSPGPTDAEAKLFKKALFVWGKTQSGKSAFQAVVMAVCTRL